MEDGRRVLYDGWLERVQPPPAASASALTPRPAAAATAAAEPPPPDASSPEMAAVYERILQEKEAAERLHRSGRPWRLGPLGVREISVASGGMPQAGGGGAVAVQ